MFNYYIIKLSKDSYVYGFRNDMYIRTENKSLAKRFDSVKEAKKFAKNLNENSYKIITVEK